MGIKDVMRSFLFENVEPDEVDTDDVDGNEAEENSPSALVSKPATMHEPNVHATYTEPALTPVRDDVHHDFVSPQQAAPSQVVKNADPEPSMPFDLGDLNEDTDQPVKKETKKTARKIVPVRRREQTNGEYTAILSPIFGNLPEDKKDTDKLHDAINLPEPQENSEMIRVISPMYGNTEKPKKITFPVQNNPTTAQKPVMTNTSKAAPEKEDKQSQKVTNSHQTSHTRITDELLAAAKQKALAENGSQQVMDLAAYLSRPSNSQAPGNSSKEGDGK